MRVRFKPGLKLMDHQVVALKTKMKWPIGADLSEVGTGKTASMLVTLQARRDMGHSRRILWVTTKTMKDETAQELVRWTWLEPTVLRGDSRTKANTLSEALKNGDCCVFINYDSVILIEEELVRARFDSVVCDEASAIKNPASKRSKAIHEIAKTAKLRWIMTGTPVPNTVLDVFGQWKFVEPTLFEDLKTFKNEYCIYKNNSGFPTIVGYKNLDSLQHLIMSRSVRFLRDECFQLPGRVFIRRDIRMGPAQRSAYKELKETLMLQIDADKQISATTALEAIMKFSQITSGFVIDEDGEVHELAENTKLDELLTVLDECDLRNTKVIVWCVFRHSIAKLTKVLADLQPAFVHGDVMDDNRSAQLDRFRNDPNCRVLIAQEETGMGFTVNEAAISIYYEMTYSWMHRDQSLGRNYRIGQAKKVVVYDLIVKGTVDVAKLAAIEAKKNLQDMVTGDGLRRAIDGEE